MSTSTIRFPNDWQLEVDRPEESRLVWDPMREVRLPGRWTAHAIDPQGLRYPLTPNDLEAVRRDGYAVLPGLIEGKYAQDIP